MFAFLLCCRREQLDDQLTDTEALLVSQAKAVTEENNRLRRKLDRVRSEKSELEKSLFSTVDRVRREKSELEKSFGEKVKHVEALKTKLRHTTDLLRKEQQTKDDELDRVRREKSEPEKSFREKVKHAEALETKLRFINDLLRKEQQTKDLELDRVRKEKSELEKSFREKVKHAEALETKLRFINDLLRKEQQTKDLEFIRMREENVALQTMVFKSSRYVTELEQRLERKAANIKAQASQTDQDDIIFSGCDSEMFDTCEYWNTYYQYRPDITDRWFQIEVERSGTAQPPGRPTRAVIRMYNALEDYDVDAPDVRLRNGEKIYYHGTDAHSARNILKNGIVLKNSTRPADFSQGYAFYVTKDFNRAVEWSMKIAKWRRLGTHGAVIGFKIGRNLRKEQTHLSLKMSNNEDIILWQCIVCHFRNGETSPDVANALRSVKFIKGPVSRNAFLRPQQLPSPYNFTQLCIRDSEYARRFGSLENISCVIFFM